MQAGRGKGGWRVILGPYRAPYTDGGKGMFAKPVSSSSILHPLYLTWPSPHSHPHPHPTHSGAPNSHSSRGFSADARVELQSLWNHFSPTPCAHMWWSEVQAPEAPHVPPPTPQTGLGTRVRAGGWARLEGAQG